MNKNCLLYIIGYILYCWLYLVIFFAFGYIQEINAFYTAELMIIPNYTALCRIISLYT